MRIAGAPIKINVSESRARFTLVNIKMRARRLAIKIYMEKILLESNQGDINIHRSLM